MSKLRHRNEEELSKAVVSIQQKLGVRFALHTHRDQYITQMSFLLQLLFNPLCLLYGCEQDCPSLDLSLFYLSPQGCSLPPLG